ncbi:hypothetical protein [Muricoccus aerilatus]|uniref:hypothetical protein n=1 Tax=Muricoccus aerilatus TaxID=452982 RepID=UPI0005C188AA|nr:hypothetical protein [Roseomonas aerilata]
MISRLSAFLTTLFLVAAFPEHSAAAFEATAEIGTAQPRAPKAIFPSPPLRLDWNSPDKALWVTGESPAPAWDAAGSITSASGWGSAGLRHETSRVWGLALTSMPLIRSAALWREGEARSRQAIGAALVEELSLALPGGPRLRAKAGIGQRAGLADPGGRGTAPGLAFRAEAGLSTSLGFLGRAGTRLDLQIVSLKGLGGAGGQATCEVKLELAAERALPLRLGGSCPGAPGAAHVTLGIGGWF